MATYQLATATCPSSYGLEPRACPLFQLLKAGETQRPLSGPRASVYLQLGGLRQAAVDCVPLSSDGHLILGWVTDFWTMGNSWSQFSRFRRRRWLHSWQFAVEKNAQATVGRGRRLCPGPWPPPAVMDGPQLGRRSRHPDQPLCLRLSPQDVTLLIPLAEQSFLGAGLLPQSWEPGARGPRGWAQRIGLADQPPAFVSPGLWARDSVSYHEGVYAVTRG